MPRSRQGAHYARSGAARAHAGPLARPPSPRPTRAPRSRSAMLSETVASGHRARSVPNASAPFTDLPRLGADPRGASTPESNPGRSATAVPPRVDARWPTVRLRSRRSVLGGWPRGRRHGWRPGRPPAPRGRPRRGRPGGRRSRRSRPRSLSDDAATRGRRPLPMPGARSNRRHPRVTTRFSPKGRSRRAYSRPAARRPTAIISGPPISTRKPSRMRRSTSSGPAVIAHGSPAAVAARSTVWSASSVAAASPP